MSLKVQALVEVRRVTERFPSGQVKRTEHVRFEWMDSPTPLYIQHGDEVICSPSSSYTGRTIRTVKENEP